jgi:hypothetical protein
MKLALFPAALVLCCAFAHAEGDPAPEAKIDPALTGQIERLVNLLSDSFATGYPDATLVQTLDIGTSEQLHLAVFTVEGFSMGNSYNQYLAVFELDANQQDEPHYRLIDVMQIGGDSFRAIDNLNATASRDEKTRVITFNIPATANAEDDSPNFPSQPMTIHLTLDHDRLAEQKP